MNPRTILICASIIGLFATPAYAQNEAFPISRVGLLLCKDLIPQLGSDDLFGSGLVFWSGGYLAGIQRVYQLMPKAIDDPTAKKSAELRSGRYLKNFVTIENDVLNAELLIRCKKNPEKKLIQVLDVLGLELSERQPD